MATPTHPIESASFPVEHSTHGWPERTYEPRAES